MLNQGKKIQEWIKKKPKLIEIYFEKGITRCENCNSKFYLDFHHRPKRSTQEAVHDFEHTRLLCQVCHDHFEYNEEDDIKLFEKPRGFDPKFKIDFMQEKEKNKSKKADWQRPHKCKHCKIETSLLICHNCGKMSV
jgi:hypothetical protein